MGAISSPFPVTFDYVPSRIFRAQKLCLLLKPLPGASHIGYSVYLRSSAQQYNLKFYKIHSLSVSHIRNSTIQSESRIPLCIQDDSSNPVRRKRSKRGSNIRTYTPKDKTKAFSDGQLLSELEIEILQFMENSHDPFSFPTKSELLRAGRADLVDAILSKGGWLSAGWDDGPDTNTNMKTLHDTKETHNGAKDRLKKASECKSQPLLAADMEHKHVDIDPTLSDTNMSSGGNHSSTLERQRGWERFADLFGLMGSQKKPGHFGETHLIDAQVNPRESSVKASLLNSDSSSVEPVESILSCDKLLEEGTDLDQLPPGIQNLNCVPLTNQHEKKLKVVRKEDTSPSQSLVRINEHVDKRKEWLTNVKSRSCRKSDGSRRVADNRVSVSSRIQGLETQLISTLHMLQSGKHALTHGSQPSQKHDLALREIEEASDALEFRETEVLTKRGELRKVRAQLTASEGKLALQLMELQKNIDEKDKRLKEARRVMKMVRTARIVYPNPAVEVLLTGSFDGWTSQRKMQKSSAGVFVTTLQLYPGRYEIKFIVNGEWNVDPNRPITRDSGFENNLLIIS